MEITKKMLGGGFITLCIGIALGVCVTLIFTELVEISAIAVEGAGRVRATGEVMMGESAAPDIDNDPVIDIVPVN